MQRKRPRLDSQDDENELPSAYDMDIDEYNVSRAINDAEMEDISGSDSEGYDDIDDINDNDDNDDNDNDDGNDDGEEKGDYKDRDLDSDADDDDEDDEDGGNNGNNTEIVLKERGVEFDKGILTEDLVHKKTGKDATTLFNEIKVSDQKMILKKNPENYPLYVTGTGRFYLESFAPHYAEAYDFVVTIADPVTRQKYIQEFKLNKYSLFSAIVIGKDYEYVKANLQRFLKTTEIPPIVEMFIHDTMEKYGRARLVLRGDKYMVESYIQSVINELARDKVFKKSWMISKKHLEREKPVKKTPATVQGAPQNTVAPGQKPDEAESLESKLRSREVDIRYYHDDDDDESLMASSISTEVGSSSLSTTNAAPTSAPIKKFIYGFEIDNADIEEIKKRGYDLGYPLIEEYSYKDEPKIVNPSPERNQKLVPLQDEVIKCEPLPINLKSFVSIRPYQEKSLSRMFASSRARSGIIVLACGAGKTLVGITAACTIQKSCLVVCNSTVSVHQWKEEFMKWSDIEEESIALFTRDGKKDFNTSKMRPLVIANYNILTMDDANVNKESRKIREAIGGREWGVIILDEVHVLMANMFKDVIKKIKAHCKLGLTATLIREDKKIEEANFLIGPKLYEANWMDLARNGFLATVQCIEVRCKMEENFLREYLMASNISTKRLLAVLNPNKMRCCHFLVKYHADRGDKIIIFADLVRVLDKCKDILGDSCRCIKGKTGDKERMEILEKFRKNEVNTLIISRVGDTSIDLPDANVIIQISSQFGSRRQEAQRLGRILRKKQGKYATDEVNAFFYTLVSQDTNEMYYTSKRQQFLIDQGYSYKVIPDLESYYENYYSKTDLCFENEEDCKGLLEYAKSPGDKKSAKDGTKKGPGKRGRPGAPKRAKSINMIFKHK